MIYFLLFTLQGVCMYVLRTEISNAVPTVHNIKLQGKRKTNTQVFKKL